MTCADWTAKLDAYLDGELNAKEIAQLETHLRECPACATDSLQRVQWKRAIRSAGQRYVADRALRERVQRQISAKSAGRQPVPFWRWAALTVPALAVLVIAGAFLINQNAQRARSQQIQAELVDLHVATLASATPVDVLSSDRHTVKPWFEGKIPFTFNLPDLNGSSFELIGGRVTYLNQLPGAELLFRMRKHQITAFIVQERVEHAPLSKSQFPDGEMEARSFHLESWEHNGLRYFLVGDVGPADLRELKELLLKAQ